MREALLRKSVGTSTKRIEDPRLLSGQGRYIDDLTVPGMAHAAFLRSPWPHALIRGIETSAAAAHPGVLAVLTGTDLKHVTHPFFGVVPLPGLYGPPHWALATDRVRMVGDPVAIVVAESRSIAEDACDLIDVDYEPLEPVATIADALNAAKPSLWPRANGNVMFQAADSYGDVAAAFATADRVIRQRFTQHRHSNQPMETRGSVAEVDATTGALAFHSSTQAVQLLRWSLAFFLERQTAWVSTGELFRQRHRVGGVLRSIHRHLKANPAIVVAARRSLPILARQFRQDPRRTGYLMNAILGLLAKDPTRLPHVEAGDVGGAFGAKLTAGREDVAVSAAALALGRSVKWIEDRNEHLMVGGHARDETLELEAAVREDGTVLGLRVRLTLDSGAYQLFPYGAELVCRAINIMFPGPYRIGALQFETTMVATNKGPYGSYRGPWAAETWVRERMLDIMARELGLCRAEIRLRNLHRAEELPARMVTGPTLDVRMSARATLERALEIADFARWSAVQAEARGSGRYLGLGVATYIEAAPGPPGFADFVAPGFGAVANTETVYAVLEADGTLALITQQQPHGQGHETTLAQVTADTLGVPPETVRLRYGDSQTIPFGVGTGGSKAAAMAGGAAILAAEELRSQIIDVASDLLEAAPGDVVLDGDGAFVRGTPAVHVTMSAIAREALRRRGVADGPNGQRRQPPVRPSEALRGTGVWDGGAGGWSQATHACWVDIDLDTGIVRIPRYVVVEDCGEMINPAIVDGQIRGGIAQGIGSVLYEKSVYDESAQFQSGTFMDYLLPTAMEIPDIEIHHLETPTDIPANFRGVGEGGMIAAPAALTNAIEDALAHLGVRITEQHLPPFRILELAGRIPTTSSPAHTTPQDGGEH